MGNTASLDKSDPSTQITCASELSSDREEYQTQSSAHYQGNFTKPHLSRPSNIDNDDAVNDQPSTSMSAKDMAGSNPKRSDFEVGIVKKNEANLRVRKKSSTDLDDEAISKFCVEIDRVLEGQDSVEAASLGPHRAKQPSVSSVSGEGGRLPRLAAATTGELPHERRGYGPLHTQGIVPTDSHSVEPKPTLRRNSDNQQLEHLHLHHQSTRDGYEQDYGPGHSSAPPPLAKKRIEKPISTWQRPEDLIQQERILRTRYQDSWHQRDTSSDNQMSGTSLTSRNSSTMHVRRHSDAIVINDDTNDFKTTDTTMQEKGFDIARFKAANKKTNRHELDKLLPATYKGYNTSLSRQGTLPSLHTGSTSSTLSSSGTPASDRQGSSLGPDIAAPKYNASEEELLDFIEKEFS